MAQGDTNLSKESESRVKRGRPAKITLAVVERIGRLIAKGLTEEQACLRIGINHSSFRTARHRNAEFETAIKKAQAEYLDESLDRIAEGVRGWQGRAWILERRHKPQFTRVDRLNANDNSTIVLHHPDGDETVSREKWEKEILPQAQALARVRLDMPLDDCQKQVLTEFFENSDRNEETGQEEHSRGETPPRPGNPPNDW